MYVCNNLLDSQWALMKLLKAVAKQVLEKLEDQVEVFIMKAIATARAM